MPVTQSLLVEKELIYVADCIVSSWISSSGKYVNRFEELERVQAAVRQRVLGLFGRRGLLSSETVAVMQGWGHKGGFSVHAGERVAAQDSAGRCPSVSV